MVRRWCSDLHNRRAGGRHKPYNGENVSRRYSLAFVQVNAATPQTNQSAVSVTYANAQVAGDTNILAIGWNNATSNISSVIYLAGNTCQLAVPTARGTGISQAIYYAKNIKAAAAGTNTVTVAFNASTPFVDIRALEYSGLDPVNPFDVGTSASDSGTSANSGTVTTTSAGALIFGAGFTTGGFSAAGANFVKPHHHHPRCRHRRRPVCHFDRQLQRHSVARRLCRMGHAGRDIQGCVRINGVGLGVPQARRATDVACAHCEVPTTRDTARAAQQALQALKIAASCPRTPRPFSITVSRSWSRQVSLSPCR